MIIPPHLHVLAPTLHISDNSVSLSLSDFNRIIAIAVASIVVDEKWYREAYVDVAEAIEEGRVLSAADHYRGAGYLEGRLPVRPVVDEEWYLSAYPDVSVAISEGRIADAFTHFIQSGYREGRLPRSTLVDAKWYFATYPRAKRRVERGISQSAQDDFFKFGYREGLFPFKPSLYARYVGEQAFPGTKIVSHRSD